MSTKLQGKVAVVTGASKGIGAGIAKALAEAGAKVVVNYASSKDGAEKTVKAIVGAGGKAIAVQGDMAKQADVTKLFAEATKAFGSVDVLVNNAGIYAFSPLEEITEDSFHKQFNLNVLGLLLASKEAAKAFGDKGGSIINISSGVTSLTPPNSAIYTGTKGAVDAILIETEGTKTSGFNEGDFKQWVESTAPLGRMGQVDDIAPTAVYLASDDSKYMTGETLLITGGMR
jgi:3-oxoacyl-[acyl-carrier protein] reductase